VAVEKSLDLKVWGNVARVTRRREVSIWLAERQRGVTGYRAVGGTSVFASLRQACNLLEEQSRRAPVHPVQGREEAGELRELLVDLALAAFQGVQPS